MTNQLLFWFFTLTITINLDAQSKTSNAYWMNHGVAFPSTKETHYTSKYRNGIGYTFQIGYDKQTSRSITGLSFMFLYSSQGKKNISYSTILRPEVKYEFLKSTSRSGLKVGGYYDIGTVLNFRRGIWSIENGINYTIWSSLGFSTQYSKHIKYKEKCIDWNTEFSIPVLSYLIRPSYTFPYTDNYLENEVFNFDRSGLGKSIITGGKLVTLDKFIYLGFQTGVSIPSKNKFWEFGLRYSFKFTQTNEVKPMHQTIHEISFLTKILN